MILTLCDVCVCLSGDISLILHRITQTREVLPYYLTVIRVCVFYFLFVNEKGVEGYFRKLHNYLLL